jgi:glutathione S-transferase
MGFPAVLKSGEGAQFPTAKEFIAWALAFLTDQPFGRVITYAELASVLTVNPAEDHRARSALLRAGRVLQREHHKQIVNVRNVGYRVIEPKDHVGVSRAQNRRAIRRLRESLATATYVAMESLTPAETAEVLMQQARVAIQVGLCTRVTKAKVVPPREQVHLPSGAKLLEMMRRRPKTG